MSNNKQSSVDWLAKQLKAKMQMWNSTKNYQEFHIVLEAGEFAKLIDEAKEMHMQEICDAHYYGQESDRMADTWNDHPEYWACEYYLKKFNNQQ